MASFTNNWKKDEITMRGIRNQESLIPLTFCDNCGEEKKCKKYPLAEGNAILCSKCWNKERLFQTSDSRGYSIMDGSEDEHKRNFHSWHMTEWYNPNPT